MPRRLQAPRESTDKNGPINTDGNVLAFVRRGPPNVVHNHRVLVQSVSGGEPRVLAVSAGSVLDLDWSADGLSLIVACRMEGIDLLLRTPRRWRGGHTSGYRAERAVRLDSEER